jgi:hypothetical protein
MRQLVVALKVIGGIVAALLLITVVGGLAGWWDEDEAPATPDSASATATTDASPPTRSAPADAMVLEGEAVDSRALESGKTYRAARKLPLMPAFEPPKGQALAAIAAIVELPPGEPFTVVGTRSKSGNPWYQVRTRLGGGWINSGALVGDRVVAAP